jgi:hypothetical protein
MFRPLSGTFWTYTAAQPCQPGITLNFLVAGMLANTTYVLQYMIVGPSGTQQSAPQNFTTGALPSTITFPSFVIRQPPDAGADSQLSAIIHMLLPASNTASLLATDLDGNVIWYYDPVQSGLSSFLPTRLEPGGTVFLLGSDGRGPGDNVLREVDLAGNPLRETSVDEVNAQLVARGQEPIYSFHHEAINLPNGDTAVLGSTQRTINGHDMAGDMIIVLDANFQVTWTWDAFDFLDTNRHAILGELCGAVCPDPQAEDWLHSNSIGWSPTDGDLTLSMRDQDWVIKIDYRNGSGDGHVVWRLGLGGDFTIQSTDPYPWFSHQHDAHYIDPTTMVVFDDGNTRCQGSVAPCDSRGQVYSLDEQHLVATPLLNADLGNYSGFLGSAERLPNGDYAYGSGGQIPGFGQSIEVHPDGTVAYVQEVSSFEYRSYRVADLYSGTDPGFDPCPDPLICATPTVTDTPVPATSTPSVEPTAVTPPTSTPITPPSNTPITPPTNTPITPPSSTPVTPPSNTPITPPTRALDVVATNTPVMPSSRPTSTQTASPTSTQITAPAIQATSTAMPTATSSPTGVPPTVDTTKNGAKPSHGLATPAVTVDIPHGTVGGGRLVVVTIRTKPHSRIGIRTQVWVQLPVAKERQPHHPSRDMLVYQNMAHTNTDGTGLATARLRVKYAPPAQSHGRLDIRVETPLGLVTRVLQVTVKR